MRCLFVRACARVNIATGQSKCSEDKKRCRQKRNARSYNFELSFPQNGEVTFEPWHWRFEGETEAIEQFYGRD